MDSTNAKIFHMDGESVKESRAIRHDHDHHTHNKTDAKQKDSPRFFTDIANHLDDRKAAVLLVGPGVAKNHFVTYLDTHHQKALAQRIVGTEDMDHPTDAQIVAYARRYFPKT
jgi:stalled ribosome rescue protein Dom34